MPLRTCFPVAVSLTALALTATPAAAQRQTYVAATNETVVSTTEERDMDPPAHLIFVDNRSTVPVVVFSVRLSGCENVKQQCYMRPVRIQIRPGRRELVTRVEPASSTQGFTYQFSFSWHADSSSIAAVAALAAGGNSTARAQLASIRHADSLDRTAAGPHANELTRDDFAALGARAVTLRPAPDSLVLAPGERASLDRIRILVVDAQGVVLGRTRWLRWSVPNGRIVEYDPADQTMIARSPGRAVLRYRLADEAQQLLQHAVEELDVPVVVAYPVDPHAPTFAGTAVDADAHTPLACARVALSDSADNVVAESRTDRVGGFSLRAPRPGTYRVGVETQGWATVYGPSEPAAADARNTHEYPVRFTDRILTMRQPMDAAEFQHAYPASVTTPPFTGSGRATSAPIVRAVTLGGSESAPVLGIVGRVPEGRAWMEFIVDSTGRVDPASVLLPSGTGAAALASVKSVLPRVRFAPARDGGRATCELLRMEVAFRQE
ncbi:MAG: carboxypeptidase-like regulatory domain-containing protein [Candidatus Eremiobacteraeota bacterium]|nr:carboxypeptidase-like regulatory domain-containing protein [Candidatus Eremiobacteraeota bacterium]